jgi:hypothetical protein
MLVVHMWLLGGPLNGLAKVNLGSVGLGRLLF